MSLPLFAKNISDHGLFLVNFFFKKMTITNCEPSQKSIKRNSNSKQSDTDLKNRQRYDQVPRRNEYPLLTGHTIHVLFVVIGKKIGKVRTQLSD